MRITKTITISPEIWVKLQLRTDNVSGTIEELCKNYISTTEEIDREKSSKQHKLELREKEIEIANLKKRIMDIEKQREQDKPVMVLE